MKKIFFIGLIISMSACSTNTNSNSDKAVTRDSVQNFTKTSLKKERKDTFVIDIHLKNFMDTLKPILGYRFMIKGDFNGDGEQETITEHFVSRSDNKETCKYYSNLDYDQTVSLTMQKEVFCYISSSTDKIDSLFISGSSQLFGLTLLHNEGDLDGNGTDEISYVIDNADWSGLNRCHVMTFTKKGWKELLSFPVHEFNIPDAPEASVSYGLFGADYMEHYEHNDTLNQQLENQLKQYSFIRKIKNGVIEVYQMSMESNDSIAIGDDYLKVIHLK